MTNLIRRSEAQELLKCFTEKNNLGHTPYQIVSNLPSAGPKWIPCKERLPEIWVKVLSFQPTFDGDGCGMIRGAVYIGNGKWRETEHHEMMELPVTHWMPLPEPPKEEET